jgi:hypothetical protein
MWVVRVSENSTQSYRTQELAEAVAVEWKKQRDAKTDDAEPSEQAAPAAAAAVPAAAAATTAAVAAAEEKSEPEVVEASHIRHAQTERVQASDGDAPNNGEQEGGTAAAAVADPDAAAKSDDQTEQPRRTARKAQKTQVYVPPEAEVAQFAHREKNRLDKGCAKCGRPMGQSDKTWARGGDYAGLHYHKKCRDLPFPASQEQLNINMAGSRVFTGETDSRVEAEATKRKRSAPDTFDEEATKASYTQRAQTERVRPSDGEQEGGTAAAAVADPDAAAKSDDQTEQPRRTARKAQKTQVYVPPEARGEALPNGRWEPEKAWSEEEEAMLIRLVEEEAFGGWKTKAEQLGTGRDRDAVRAKAVSIRAEKERELMKGPLPVGTHVEALYHHIKPHDYWAWYPAQVKEVDKRGQTYIIEWYDGDTNLRKQPAKNVRPVPWGVPPPTDQEPAAGRVAQQMRTKRGLESGDEASDDSSEEKDDDEPDEEQDDSRNTKKRQRPVKQHDERDDERSRRKVSKGGLMEEGRYTAERAWTQSELASLISAVHENGPGHWMLTSYIVASESGKNCTPRVLLCLRVCWLTRRSVRLFDLSGRPVRSHHAVGKMWLKLQERRHHTAQDASSSGSDEAVPVMSMRSSAWQHGETVAKKQKNQKQQQAKGETEEDKWTKHASVADVITDRGLPAGSNFMILQCCENQLEGLYHHWRGYIFKYATIRRPKTPPTLYDASTGGLNYPVFETKTGRRLTFGFS